MNLSKDFLALINNKILFSNKNKNQHLLIKKLHQLATLLLLQDQKRQLQQKLKKMLQILRLKKLIKKRKKKLVKKEKKL
jgi:hypothetical protein